MQRLRKSNTLNGGENDFVTDEPMYTQVRSHILDLVNDRGILPGQKLPSIRWMGEAIGVGRGTVAKAVAEMTNEGILQSRPAKGIYLNPPSDLDRAVPMKTIYCLSCARETEESASEYIWHSPFWGKVLHGIRKAVLDKDSSIRLRMAYLSSLLNEYHVSPRRRNWQEMGIITLGNPAPGEISRIVSLGASAIQIHGKNRSPKIPSIRVDSCLGTELLVNHLVSLGHKRICYCGATPRRKPQESVSSPRPPTQEWEKYRGFQRAMEQKGLPMDPALCIQECFIGFEEGYHAAQELLGKPERPTAAIVSNDETAIGFMRALADAGLRIPQDISVTGFDNLPSSKYMIPSLTTVDGRMNELGEMSVSGLFSLQDQGFCNNRILKPDIIVRESTACPAK